MNKIDRLNEINRDIDKRIIDWDDVLSKFKEWYIEKEEAIDDKDTTVLGLSMERIAFMKQYFKEKGFDPEADDFESNILLYNPVKPIYTYIPWQKQDSYTYTPEENIRVTYTFSTSNKEEN